MSPRSHNAFALLVIALAIGLGAGLLPSLAQAAQGAAADHDSQFANSHPRREQVNERLANQDRRIKTEVAEGELTARQAARLHRKDRQIRREERLMASQNGGHITRAEQRALNQQENKVSRQIGK